MCNKDCFNCVFSDCINDEISNDDLTALEEIEKIVGLIKPKKKSGYTKERKRQYYYEHKDKFREYKRKYYQENKERLEAYQKEYTAKHRQEIDEKRKAIRLAKTQM